MVVAAFGGFTLDAGVVHLSVHNWRPLLAVLVLAMGALLWGDRLDSRRALEAVEGRVERHAIAVVVIVAAATAAIGLGQGTWAASGADASGYVSQARLLADGTLVDTEPLATRVMLPTGSWAFAPLGYRPGLMPGLLAPTYPIGLPLAMAPFVRLWGDSGAYVVVPLLGALAVLATFGVGTVVASRTAGLVASVLVATSPVFLFQLVQPMSDVAVTAWWSLAIALALARFPGAPIGAGLVSGLAIATRPNLLPMASVPVLVCVLGAHGRARRMASAAGFAVGVAPSVFMVFWLQARLFGSALTSGYGSAGDLYAFDNILPNVAAYAWRIVRDRKSTRLNSSHT